MSGNPKNPRPLANEIKRNIDGVLYIKCIVCQMAFSQDALNVHLWSHAWAKYSGLPSKKQSGRFKQLMKYLPKQYKASAKNSANRDIEEIRQRRKFYERWPRDGISAPGTPASSSNSDVTSGLTDDGLPTLEEIPVENDFPNEQSPSELIPKGITSYNVSTNQSPINKSPTSNCEIVNSRASKSTESSKKSQHSKKSKCFVKNNKSVEPDLGNQSNPKPGLVESGPEPEVDIGPADMSWGTWEENLDKNASGTETENKEIQDKSEDYNSSGAKELETNKKSVIQTDKPEIELRPEIKQLKINEPEVNSESEAINEPEFNNEPEVNKELEINNEPEINSEPENSTSSVEIPPTLDDLDQSDDEPRLTIDESPPVLPSTEPEVNELEAKQPEVEASVQDNDGDNDEVVTGIDTTKTSENIIPVSEISSDGSKNENNFEIEKIETMAEHVDVTVNNEPIEISDEDDDEPITNLIKPRKPQTDQEKLDVANGFIAHNLKRDCSSSSVDQKAVKPSVIEVNTRVIEKAPRGRNRRDVWSQEDFERANVMAMRELQKRPRSSNARLPRRQEITIEDFMNNQTDDVDIGSVDDHNQMVALGNINSTQPPIVIIQPTDEIQDVNTNNWPNDVVKNHISRNKLTNTPGNSPEMMEPDRWLPDEYSRPTAKRDHKDIIEINDSPDEMSPGKRPRRSLEMNQQSFEAPRRSIQNAVFTHEPATLPVNSDAQIKNVNNIISQLMNAPVPTLINKEKNPLTSGVYTPAPNHTPLYTQAGVSNHNLPPSSFFSNKYNKHAQIMDNYNTAKTQSLQEQKKRRISSGSGGSFNSERNKRNQSEPRLETIRPPQNLLIPHGQLQDQHTVDFIQQQQALMNQQALHMQANHLIRAHMNMNSGVRAGQINLNPSLANSQLSRIPGSTAMAALGQALYNPLEIDARLRGARNLTSTINHQFSTLPSNPNVNLGEYSGFVEPWEDMK